MDERTYKPDRAVFEDQERKWKELREQAQALLKGLLATHHSRREILEYLDRPPTEIAPEVVEGWLNGTRVTTESLQNKIIKALERYQSPEKYKPIRPPLAPKPERQSKK